MEITCAEAVGLCHPGNDLNMIMTLIYNLEF